MGEEAIMTKKLMILVCLLLAGCGMTDDEVRQAKAECRAKDGEPVVMATLYGAIDEVRCW
jgi:hypothetical protein